MRFIKISRKRKFRNYKSVIALLVVLGVVAFMGQKTKLAEIKTVEAAYFKDQAQTLTKTNIELGVDVAEFKERLNHPVVTANVKTAAIARYYIQKYFGKDAATVERVMTCESGLDNTKSHENKDGSLDMGLYQIHDESTHRKNFQAMYGVSLAVGAYDFDLSSKYAKFLWDRSPNNWVCYRLLVEK